MAGFGSLAPEIDPYTGMPLVPSPEAQAAVEKGAGAIWGGLKHFFGTPGDVAAGKYVVTPEVPGQWSEIDEYKQQLANKGITDWGASTAMGMVGMGRLPGAAPPGSAGIGGAKLAQPEVPAAAVVDSGFGALAPAAPAIVKRERLPMDQEARVARADEQGYAPDQVWYHGTPRADRLTEKGKIDPRRATSGPMPYFTDSAEMASSYAMGKKPDTSMPDFESVAQAFTVSPKDLGLKGMRSDIPVERSWWLLPPEVRQTISERAKRIGYANPDQATGPLTLHPPGVDASLSSSHYDWVLKNEAKGNPLAALREMWHDSGSLVGNESALSEIYRLAGYPARISEKNAPWTEARGVMPAHIRMRNPLLTENEGLMTRDVIPALEQAFKRDRSRVDPYGADMWDKNHRFTPRDWVQNAKEDYLKGDNSFVWTSIPDKVTDQFRRLGFDSIIDTGGKMGGPGHRVAIPFSPDQVRSVYAKYDPKSEGKGLILGSGSNDVRGNAAVAATAAPRERSFGSLAPEADVPIRSEFTGRLLNPAVEGMPGLAPFEFTAAEKAKYAPWRDELIEMGGLSKTEIDDRIRSWVAGDRASAEFYQPGVAERMMTSNLAPGTRSVKAPAPAAPLSISPGTAPNAAQLRLPGLEAPPQAPYSAAPSGIRAYHGSPHDFDRFDLGKIGTGEGAQSYGHGLYFAENEAVARGYRDTLAPSRGKIPDGVISMPHESRSALMAQVAKDADPLTAAKRAQYASPMLRQENVERLAELIQQTRDAKRGKMYEVDLKAKPEQFLDWDKPLRDQPAVEGIHRAQKNMPMGEDMPFSQWAREAGSMLDQPGQFWAPRTPVGAANYREAGIPGIRYLDQGSRPAGDASRIIEKYGSREKALEVAQERLAKAHYSDRKYWQDVVDQVMKPETSNYVVFDPGIIDILRKYGLAGLTAGGGVAASGGFGNLAPQQ